jgi:hypothetical protein
MDKNQNTSSAFFIVQNWQLLVELFKLLPSQREVSRSFRGAKPVRPSHDKKDEIQEMMNYFNKNEQKVSSSYCDDRKSI